MSNAKDKIVVALDTSDYGQVQEWVKELADYVGYFKVGKELFISFGPKIIEMIKESGGKVFLDLKLHDIPTTVAKASAVITSYGVDIFNVHASGGYDMMARTVEAVKAEAAKRNMDVPTMLAVTVLTSLNDEVLKDELKWVNNAKDQVVNLAALTKKAGMDGVVCSPKEIEIIKEKVGADFEVLTPGIRPAWSQTNDQKRIMTPKDALEAGADYLVIGRPITQAADPVEAAKKILEEMKGN